MNTADTAPPGPLIRNALELNEQLEHVQANFKNAAQLDQCIERLVQHVAPQQIEEIARLRGFPKIASAARRWARSHAWPA